MAQWTPIGDGAGFKFSRILKPLESFREHITVVTGCALNAENGHAISNSRVQVHGPAVGAAVGVATHEISVTESLFVLNDGRSDISAPRHRPPDRRLARAVRMLVGRYDTTTARRRGKHRSVQPPLS